MDRRDFLHTMGAVAVVAALPRYGTRRVAGRAPNILLIVSDDLGYADLSITGRGDYQTPVIDQLARDGALLTQAYAAAPVCTPTRVAIMTGRYPARYAVGLYEPLTTQNVGLEPHPATLARLLKNAGYDTALVGKWHLGSAAAVPSAASRLRRVLRLSWRRGRLHQPRRCGRADGLLLPGRGPADPASRLPDGSLHRTRGPHRERPRA